MTAEPIKKNTHLYTKAKSLYFLLAGSPTSRNIWNFKYLATRELHRDLKSLLSERSGSIIDFGCGAKPYKQWFENYSSYVGVDMYEAPEVDVLVEDGGIPLDDNQFDIALATQVFEHTESLDYLSELHRVLKKGGEVIISVPFLYHVHENFDHRRLTKQGLEKTLLDHGFSLSHMRLQGGIGSTKVIMRFYFVDALFRNHLPKWLFILLLPLVLLWLIVFVPIGNILGIIFDELDTTNKFYNNVIAVAQKK